MERKLDNRYCCMTSKSMLSQGVITVDEFIKIETKMCEKYCINLSSIFRDNGSK